MARPRTKNVGESKPKEEKAIVRVTRKYFDTDFNKEMNPPSEFDCSKDRCKTLTDAKVVEIVMLKK